MQEAPGSTILRVAYMAASTGSESRPTLPDIEVIHVLPDTVEGKDCIDFENFATIAEDRGEIGKRFAASLRSWSDIEAGDRWPDSASAR